MAAMLVVASVTFVSHADHVSAGNAQSGGTLTTVLVVSVGPLRPNPPLGAKTAR